MTDMNSSDGTSAGSAPPFLIESPASGLLVPIFPMSSESSDLIEWRQFQQCLDTLSLSVKQTIGTSHTLFAELQAYVEMMKEFTLERLNPEERARIFRTFQGLFAIRELDPRSHHEYISIVLNDLREKMCHAFKASCAQIKGSPHTSVFEIALFSNDSLIQGYIEEENLRDSMKIWISYEGMMEDKAKFYELEIDGHDNRTFVEIPRGKDITMKVKYSSFDHECHYKIVHSDPRSKALWDNPRAFLLLDVEFKYDIDTDAFLRGDKPSKYMLNIKYNVQSRVRVHRKENDHMLSSKDLKVITWKEKRNCGVQ